MVLLRVFMRPTMDFTVCLFTLRPGSRPLPKSRDDQREENQSTCTGLPVCDQLVDQGDLSLYIFLEYTHRSTFSHRTTMQGDGYTTPFFIIVLDLGTIPMMTIVDKPLHHTKNDTLFIDGMRHRWYNCHSNRDENTNYSSNTDYANSFATLRKCYRPHK